MDLDRIWAVADRARARGPLPAQDVAFLRDAVPAEFASFPELDLPAMVRHPGGFAVSGRSVGTLLRSALLVAARNALGRRFGGSAFYENVEKDLAFGIMRSHFHLGYPKGTHCCVPCTLAVYPVLEAAAIRYFDFAELSMNVRRLILGGGWRFAKPANASMLSWALCDER